MSERLITRLVGLLLMLMGVGLFLWDWFSEYIHFFWFIPFIVLGPIVFICGLIMLLRGLRG